LRDLLRLALPVGSGGALERIISALLSERLDLAFGEAGHRHEK
jgi:hypothetical protein